VTNGFALCDELIYSLLDACLGDFVIKVKASNGGEHSVGGSAREGEHEALGDVVELTVTLEGDGLPLFGSVNPVAHMIDGGISGGGS